MTNRDDEAKWHAVYAAIHGASLSTPAIREHVLNHVNFFRSRGEPAPVLVAYNSQDDDSDPGMHVVWQRNEWPADSEAITWFYSDGSREMDLVHKGRIIRTIQHKVTERPE